VCFCLYLASASEPPLIPSSGYQPGTGNISTSRWRLAHIGDGLRKKFILPCITELDADVGCGCAFRSQGPDQPGVMTEHLPFSKSTIQRALRMLVEEGVLRCKTKLGKGQTAKYSLVDEKRLKEAEGGGSKSVMTPVSEGAGSGSKPDMGGGSNSDMGGSKPDMGGSNPDNNTTLIETPLKEPCLKEPGYVDAGLPSQPSSDKLKQVKDVHPFATPVTKSGKGTGTEKSQKPKLSGTGSGPSNLQKPGSDQNGA
jgi:predicted transcriptional regulator